jgi:Succinate dehydrogenase/fumarate reductase, Fe-S protein subunit
MNFKLKIWRQKNVREQGRFETYSVEDIAPDTSFLEMLDILNDKLIREGGSPVAFDHDCREGICGMCSLYINGEAHGPDSLVTTCQLFMRRFRDGSTITVEPWRSPAFPIIKDLVVDRGAFDKIMQAGGYINVNTGGVPDANSIAVSQVNAELSMDAAACIGCGACVATCKNGSAMLFISARVSALSHLPQGRPDAARRVKAMIDEADKLGFGSCTNTRACEMECPKGIRISNIARLNLEWIKAKFHD